MSILLREKFFLQTDVKNLKSYYLDRDNKNRPYHTPNMYLSPFTPSTNPRILVIFIVKDADSMEFGVQIFCLFLCTPNRF